MRCWQQLWFLAEYGSQADTHIMLVSDLSIVFSRPSTYTNSMESLQKFRLQPVDEPRSLHPGGAMPIHPDVTFITLPFYDVVDVLIKPTSLGMEEYSLLFFASL